eukprot:Em0023g52a
MQLSKVLNYDEAATRQPDEAEQEEMAILWAMEDSNSPTGWDEGKELDYTAIVRKPSGSPEPRPQEKDLFQYAQSTSFAIRALGQLTGLQVRALSDSQSDTLEEIEKAQRQGRLPWVTTEDQQRVLSVSKYGVKVMDIKRQRVYVRYPLHAIANIIYYEDTYCKHMVAARIIKSEEMVCDISVFECKDESQAKDICLTLAQAFETVFNRVQLQKR